MSNYFVELYRKTVERHRIAIRNVGICHRAISMGDKRKKVKDWNARYDHELWEVCIILNVLNDLLQHCPELDPGKEITEYDPSDWANNCISCVPKYMTFDWLQVQELMADNPHLTEDDAYLSIFRSSDAAMKAKREIEALRGNTDPDQKQEEL